MDTDLPDLLALLELTRLDEDLFEGESRNIVGPRIFGGQVVSQALIAAARTVTDRPAHSLQAYFLRPGDARLPITYRVERVRDGGTFSTRRVVAEQRGRPIFDMAASFHTAEEGPQHQTAEFSAPDPDTLVTEHEMNAQFLENEEMSENFRAAMLRRKPVELRPVTRRHPLTPEKSPPLRQTWLRATGLQSDDPLLHQALLAYASDHNLMGAALLPHGFTFVNREVQVASLDHTVWFHRPIRIDDWLFYDMESPIATGARGFARGRVFNRQGELVASVCQEGLIRQQS
ncbi:acyl-CoA thioesterase [Alloalcanivorax mobilis]|uniref:acyl-CoA thioesterase n=1 Tax=Alloalcanivorax mobilis TaxID=2019569 RepID=UPI000B5B41D4|nr:acyl-CoA thioesterase II [Alloalcanivorax mobilis]ASK33423.1 acyl-CoA thioesterase II [Alcanivorax sp. N3-2A]|tara:strand:+ start:16014 stop:16877 length:864 start_codon:yes stop_codon:yes gene_type:complete